MSQNNKAITTYSTTIHQSVNTVENGIVDVEVFVAIEYLEVSAEGYVVHDSG